MRLGRLAAHVLGPRGAASRAMAGGGPALLDAAAAAAAASTPPLAATGPASRGLVCRRRTCGQVIDPHDARVEVSCFGSGSSCIESRAVAWEDDATLPFHRECWDAVISQKRKLDQHEQRLIQQACQTAEKFDARSELQREAARAADILRNATQAVCFTGAGLSTSAGLGDYRGKRGKWTLEAQGQRIPYTTEYEALRPTFAHEAVAKLVEMGRLAYVVTQNADGLHHLSGIPYAKLSDVHGSAFTEYCSECGRRYVRDSYVPEDRAEDYFAGRLPGPMPRHIRQCPGCKSNHWTGRSCDECGGALRDTVISFGDGLEECVLRPAFEHAARADACLSLGSTMSIGPSNRVAVMHRGPLICCVRQDTEMDHICQLTGGVRVYGDCDDFMQYLMQALLGDDFEKWEASLPAKRAVYDSMRPTVGKKRGDIFVKKW